MKPRITAAFAFSLFAAHVGLVAQGETKHPSPSTTTVAHPNFVVFFLEGTGSGFPSTSVTMDDTLPDAKAFAAATPTIGKLAADGMRFAEFYVSAPRCTPSRASLLTGMSAAKLGMTYVNEGGTERRGGEGGGKRNGGDENSAVKKLIPPTCRTELPAEVTTIAELLHDAGYATAHFGKWHVGRERPSHHGFDVDDGANTNRGPGRSEKPNPEQGVAITDAGIEFAKKQLAAKKPFYVQISHYGGGSEDEATAETRQALAAELRGMRGKTAWQAAILRDIDDQMGRVLAALDVMKVADSTYVVLVFDHGAAGRNTNAPLSGGKGSVLEGGIRVPFVVRGPGIARGVCCRVRASTADVLPTVAELAGVTSWPSEVEGGSLAAVLRGNGKGPVARPHEELVVHFPHYDLGSGPASAIFLGDYKLVRRYDDGARMLFEVRKDPGERQDLAASQAARVTEMEKRLDAYLKAIHAAMPTPNPEYGKSGDDPKSKNRK